MTEEAKTKTAHLKFSKDVKIRKQNPNCNLEGNMCLSIDNVPKCLQFSVDKNGKITMDLKPCKHEKKKVD